MKSHVIPKAMLTLTNRIAPRGAERIIIKVLRGPNAGNKTDTKASAVRYEKEIKAIIRAVI
jgi:hypothetical protein